MARSVPSANSFMVATHGYPQQNARSDVSLGKFLKGKPAVLGTIQIMIGVVVLMFGVVTAIHVVSLSAYIRIMFWGGAMYTTAGIVTIQAEQKLEPRSIKTAVGINIISAMTAVAAIIIHGVDLAKYSCLKCSDLYWSRSNGTTGVMILLSVLELIVSICVSAFACKATYFSGTKQVRYQAQSSFPTSHLSAYPVNTSEHMGNRLPSSVPTSYQRPPWVNPYEVQSPDHGRHHHLMPRY